MMEILQQVSDKLKNNIVARKLACRYSLSDNTDLGFTHFELSDPLYLPFYYFLGQTQNFNCVFEMGFGLGLCSGALLNSNKNIKTFIAFQEFSKEYYPQRIARHNIRRVYNKDFHFYYGDLSNQDLANLLKMNKPNLIIVRQKDKDIMSSYLNYAWDVLDFDGMMVVDYIDYSESNTSVFNIFCKIRNRQPFLFKTRYGHGIIIK